MEWERDVNANQTWEEAVAWLRAQPDHETLVRGCYYDDPLEMAARRFHASPEWSATRKLLSSYLPGRVLDLGAGRGIASFAFAQEGCQVTALEPDPSPLVGRGAIEGLGRHLGLAIETVGGYGERLPFDSAQFDVVYGRAVLHHARDLPALCREAARVLRPGGALLAVREHVISRPGHLQTFLDAHPLHRLYGGENAFRLVEYRAALRQAGLRIRRVLGPYDSAVNYWPMTDTELHQLAVDLLSRVAGRRLARWWLSQRSRMRMFTWCLSRLSRAPGRHYAFLGVKPSNPSS